MNDNMLVILMIETLEGVDNALEIASQPGVDVVIQGNSDLASFSGFQPSDDRYQDLLTRIRDAVYQAGKFWGNAAFSYGKGNRLSPIRAGIRTDQSNDGWVNPNRGGPRSSGKNGVGGTTEETEETVNPFFHPPARVSADTRGVSRPSFRCCHQAPERGPRASPPILPLRRQDPPVVFCPATAP